MLLDLMVPQVEHNFEDHKDMIGHNLGNMLSDVKGICGGILSFSIKENGLRGFYYPSLEETIFKMDRSVASHVPLDQVSASIANAYYIPT